MLVRDWMSKRVVSLSPTEKVERALEIMRNFGVRHLPVLKGTRLVGIVSDRDLRAVRRPGTLVGAIAKTPISITPEASVDEAAAVMQKGKFSALPVLSGARVVGILTTTDVLGAFVQLSGVREPTTRIVIAAAGRAAKADVRRIIEGCGGEVKWAEQHAGQLHVRIQARHVSDIVTALETAGFEVQALVTTSGNPTAAPRTPPRTTRPRGPARKRGTV